MVTEFSTWFAPTTTNEQLTVACAVRVCAWLTFPAEQIPFNRNTHWRAPLDAATLAKAGPNLKTTIKKAQLVTPPISRTTH